MLHSLHAVCVMMLDLVFKTSKFQTKVFTGQSKKKNMMLKVLGKESCVSFFFSFFN